MKRTWLLVFTVVASTSAARAELIAHYPFDGDAMDVVGGADGTVEGDAGPGGSGVIGGSFDFAGGHVVIPIDINPSAIPDATVTMWVKPTQEAVDNPGLYKTFGHDDGGWDRTFGLDHRNGAYRYAAFTGGARPGPTPTTGAPVTTEWTFLAAVWDTDNPAASQNTVTMYVGTADELLFVQENLFNTPSVHSSSAIGNLRPDNFNEAFLGSIDDVRIYDSALDAAAISQIWSRIPEPSSALLLIIGGVALLRRRRA